MFLVSEGVSFEHSIFFLVMSSQEVGYSLVFFMSE